MTRYLLATAGLTLVYALALASADPWDLGIGAVLSLFVLLAFGRFMFILPAVAPSDVLRRVTHLPRLALATAGTIVRGTIFVARAVLSPRLPRNHGFVVIPDRERSPSGVVISGFLETLSPGSVLIDTDPAAQTWTIHALDSSNPDVIEAELRTFYERYQRSVWP